VNVSFLDAPALDASADLIVIAVPPGFAGVQGGQLDELDARLGGGVVAWLGAKKFEPKAGDALVIATYGRIGAPQVALVGTGGRTTTELRKAAGKVGQLAREHKAGRVVVDLGALDAAAIGAVIEGVSIGNYAWERYLPEDRKRPELNELVLAGAAADVRDAASAAAQVRARYQKNARDLVNLPAAELYPETLAQAALRLDALPHVTVEVIDMAACRERGLVGIVAVGQGSERPPCLIRVSYQPPDAKETIALVGKGVTFDSGGYSIKPTDGMQTMRCDMGGAATVLAAMGAIAELGLPVRVEAFMPAVENLISGGAYKLGDILRYNNGVTVEIHNTDAEGRLILADALILAGQVPGVSRIVDLATLTGAVIIAIGSDYTGLFTSDDTLAGELSRAASANGELLWRLPLHNPYNRMFKGTWSQVKNVGGREAGSITAALFLEHFVPKTVKWAHLDIAGTAFADNPVDAYAAGGTGQVVRTLVSWVEGLAQG
jgi:leucyl aminopeptidase